MCSSDVCMLLAFKNMNFCVLYLYIDIAKCIKTFSSGGHKAGGLSIE